MRLTFAALVALIFGSPAFAQECEEGFHPIEHHVGTSCVPDEPMRIVSLRETSQTVQVFDLSLGDRLVGSTADRAPGPDGVPAFSPEVAAATGLTFGDGGVAYVGQWVPDLEVIASLEPDLIVGDQWQAESYDQLSIIAPTVLSYPTTPLMEELEWMANILGAEQAFAARLSDYDARVVALRGKMGDGSSIQYNLLWVPLENDMLLYHEFGALGRVFDDLGLTVTDAARSFFEASLGTEEAWSSAPLSPERIDIAEADILFLPFFAHITRPGSMYGDLATAEGLEAKWEGLEARIPGFCGFLAVCRADQIVAFAAEPMYLTSFAGLDAALDYVEAELADREIAQIVD